MTTHRSASTTLGLLAIVALAPVAYAQSPEDRENAQVLYKAGNDARDSGDMAAAEAKYKVAYALMQTPAIALALGKSELAIGHLIEGRQVLLGVDRIAAKPNESALSKAARAEASTLAGTVEGRIPSVNLKLARPQGVPAPTVTIDGVTIPEVALDVPRRVNPGDHVLVATVGTARTEVKFSVAEAATKDVAVEYPRANGKIDCPGSLKAAQADKAAGKFTKAMTELTTCTRPVCPKPLQKQCSDLLTAIAAIQPSVVFSAKDASGKAVTAVTVTIDGAVVTQSLDGSAVAVDPGSHAMKFESEGATPVEKQISVDPETKGQTIAIDLDVNPPGAVVAIVPVKTDATPGEPGTMFDTAEDPTKRYYFIGLRYRGNVVPQFMLNLFVNGGKTLYSNSVGLEFDLRHDNFSLIPAISYTEYGTGDILFSTKGSDPTQPGNWSVVNSSLAGIYLSADLLWTVKIAPHWDFEYGAELGLGFIFGTLLDNWVTPLQPGNNQISPSNYVACASTTSGPGCASSDHSSTGTPHVNGFAEPSWANGGSKPNIFPLINFPQLGVRYKPMKQLETRLGVGFSLTGFWFGLSANYGLEKTTK